VAGVDPNLPVSDSRTLGSQVASTFNRQRLSARLVTLFGGLALLLACTGLYGIVSQEVLRRTHEIGVRVALGAQPRQVMRMILRRTALLVAAGLFIGVPAALGGARLIATQLYNVTPTDWVSFAGAIGVLGCVGAIAGLLPARQAARVNPIVALRQE
jgi:macrolide transport system ATP-binding/permease protein